MVGCIFGGGALKCVRLHGGDGLKYHFLPSVGDAIYFLRDAWNATVLRRLTLGSDSVATMLDAFSLGTWCCQSSTEKCARQGHRDAGPVASVGGNQQYRGGG